MSAAPDGPTSPADSIAGHPRRQRVQADLLLLLAAVLWGGGFTSQRMASEHLGPATYNVLRFLVAAVVLLPFAWRRFFAGATPTPTPAPSLTGGRALVAGASLAAAMTLGSWLQQAGVAHTTAGKAGFITGLYVILVPIFGRALGHRPPATTWPAASLAVVGLFLLSVNNDWTLGRGDLLVLGSAVVWAVHVLLVGWLAPRMDGLLLAWYQLAFTALFSAPAALAYEHTTLPAMTAAAGPILYNGILCGALGFTLQIKGQRHAPAADASLIMSLESVFAALFGALFLAEHLGPRALLGGALMLFATLLSQLPALRSR